MAKMTLPLGATLLFALFNGALSTVVQQPKRVSALENTHEINTSSPLSLSISSYRSECWQKRPVSVSTRVAALFQKAVPHRNPNHGHRNNKAKPTHGDTKAKPTQLVAQRRKHHHRNRGDKAKHNHTSVLRRKSQRSHGNSNAKPTRLAAKHRKQSPEDGDVDPDGDASEGDYEDEWDTSELEGDDEDDWDTSELEGDGDGDHEDEWDTSELEGDGEDDGDGELEGGGDDELNDDSGEVDPCEVEGPERPEYCDELEHKSAVKPFETVLKDGFLSVDCIKDYMYYHGDKYGAGKFAYKLANWTGTSIVRYDMAVAKEDQKQMTPRVCFEFCRTVPDMGFFGLLNGRTCYCAPYYQSMASDSSMCDAVCPGEPTNMCGGESKSNIYEMHMCSSAAGELEASADRATNLAKTMDAQSAEAKTLSADMQKSAENLQKSFGEVGDTAATGLMQDAKVFAGEVEHQAEAVEVLAKELASLVAKSGGTEVVASVRNSEDLTVSLDKTRARGSQAAEKLAVLMESATSSANHTSVGRAKQYYPLMYFVDKDFVDEPSTCGGDSVGTPMGHMSLDACAWACDENVGTCIGFSYYAQDQLCFLMAKFTSAFYYTGCKTTAKAPVFLQQRQHAEVTCMVKFSEFERTTLKPDPSGKCKQCLKTITKADRCFE